MTFSQTSGFAAGFVRSSVSSASSAVCSFQLWQVTQYLSNTARGAAGGAAAGKAAVWAAAFGAAVWAAAGGACLAAVCTLDSSVAAQAQTTRPRTDRRILFRPFCLI